MLSRRLLLTLAATASLAISAQSAAAAEAYPSRTDIAYAAEPQAHYVLVSTAESGSQDGPVSVRSYRILDGEVLEEQLTITE